MGYYDEIAEGYNELHEEEQLTKLRIIRDNIQITKQTRLLDVGCGTGLSKKVFDCNIQGIDPSKELLKQCKFPTKQANAEEIPFKGNEFDVVIAVTSIHNFNNIEKGLKEIKRVGKDKFVLTILKKSDKKDKIQNLIKNLFSVQSILDNREDLIFLCTGS